MWLAMVVNYLVGVWLFPTLPYYLVGVFAVPLGWCMFPHDRHANRELYSGTRWRVWMGFFLTAGLSIGHTLVQLGFWVREGHPITEITFETLVAAALTTMSAAGFAVFIAWLRGDSEWSLGLHRRDLGASMWFGFRAGLLFFAMDLVGYKVGQTLDFWQLGTTNAVKVMFECDDVARGVIVLILGAICVPIAEEILFRGVLFAALRRTSGAVSAVVISSLMFGLMHLPGWVTPAIMGLMLSLLYHRTNSLWASITAHSVLNFAALGLAFNRGSLLRHLSWTHVGGLLVLVGILILIPGRRTEGQVCLCGRSQPSSRPRCPECAYPLLDWRAGFRLLGRLVFAGSWLSVGVGIIAFDQLAQRPYVKGAGGEAVGLQYELLKSSGREQVAKKLLDDWHADQPEAAGPIMTLAQEAYLQEDYATIVRLMEPMSKRTEPEQKDNARAARNILSLALAEIGGARGDEAVQLARQALDEAPDEQKRNVEDTLGWALVRVGQLEEARTYLDRELMIYGTATRAGVAEIAYHRGVLLWSIGDVERAHSVLEVAAKLEPPVAPYTKRARAILEHGCLPEGLVPSLPPPLDDFAPAKPIGSPKPVAPKPPAPKPAARPLPAASGAPGPSLLNVPYDR